MFPSFERHVVSGGTVIAADLPGRWLSAISLVLEGGAATDLPGKEGTAVLAGRMQLTETVDRDPIGFSIASELLGCTWSARVGWDSLRLDASTPSDRLRDAVELLAEAVHRPRFHAEDVDRHRHLQIDVALADFNRPRPRADLELQAAVFTPGSRYAIRAGGAPDTIQRISLEDVITFHTERVAVRNATLIIAGDLTGIDPADIGLSLFEGLSGPRQAPVEPTIVINDETPRIVLVDRPGAVQSVFAIGHAALSRKDSDYFAATTIPFSLGKLFDSRLNRAMRHESGFSYGATATFETRRRAGLFVIRTAVQRENTSAAARELHNVISRLVEGGLSDQEVQAAINYRHGALAIQFESASAVASALGDLIVYELPEDYYKQLPDRFAALSSADINSAIHRWIRPIQMVTAIIGDVTTFRSELERSSPNIPVRSSMLSPDPEDCPPLGQTP